MTKPIIDIQPEDRFTLKDDFVEQYRNRKPDFGGNGLGELVYRRTYSRPKPDGTTEQWFETVRRVIEGVYTIQAWWCHREHLPWSDRKAQRSAQEMYDRMFTFKMLPPGRGIWALGTEYVEKNGSMCLYNCSFISTADIDRNFAAPFAFLMDASMLGVGVGFDTRGAGKVKITNPKFVGAESYVVEDSREGWVGLVERFLRAYASTNVDLPAHVDYSKIRPAGEPLKGFGGVAAGPEPLMRCVAEIQRILDPLRGKPITSEAIVDLMNVIGVCVVSGNIRRSAEIALGDPDDASFLSLKDPEQNAEALRSHRWASNNSVFATVGMDYSRIAELIGKNGEPGAYWLENARAYGRMADPANYADERVTGINPCAEIPLESGECCNLVETFPSRHDSYEDYERTLKYAYLLSKTVTLMPTHQTLTNRVQKRNRRIGLSQSGIQQAIQRRGLREHLRWCDKGYQYIQKLDKMYSEWLTIPRSVKTTTVKPSGSVSTLPYVTPGIHYEHSAYYYRLVRIAKTSHLLGPLTKAGYRIEQDVYDPSSMVVYFPIKAEHFERSKAEVSIWEQFEGAAQVQHWWADNSVSITITFKPEERKEIKRALALYETRLKSVSALPLDEHGYEQAPYITITEDEYKAAVKGLKPVRYDDTASHEASDMFCDGEACELPQQHVDSSTSTALQYL